MAIPTKKGGEGAAGCRGRRNKFNDNFKLIARFQRDSFSHQMREGTAQRDSSHLHDVTCAHSVCGAWQLKTASPLYIPPPIYKPGYPLDCPWSPLPVSLIFSSAHLSLPSLILFLLSPPFTLAPISSSVIRPASLASPLTLDPISPSSHQPIKSFLLRRSIPQPRWFLALSSYLR